MLKPNLKLKSFKLYKSEDITAKPSEGTTTNAVMMIVAAILVGLMLTYM